MIPDFSEVTVSIKQHMIDNIWGGIVFCRCSHSADFYLTNVKMILFNFEEIIHCSLTWLRFILLSCRLHLSYFFFSFCFSQLFSFSKYHLLLNLFDFMRRKEILWKQALVYFSHQVKNQKQEIEPSVEAKPTTDLHVTDQLWIKQVNRQTGCLSLSLCFMSLITTWRTFIILAVLFYLNHFWKIKKVREHDRTASLHPGTNPD